ncbi:MAG: hypothetical protein P0S95_08030 [Rhabdochlamydiaceae bacterium]|nr:hypothetical protein [Candidatus Amphrikana amoebophyrae]
MLKKILVVCSLLFSILYAEEEELILHVRAKKGLSSLYMSTPKLIQSKFSDSYIEKLNQLIRQDFEFNGLSDLKKHDPSVDKILANKPHEIFKNLPARHTLAFEIHGKIWKTTLFSAAISLGIKQEDIHLTGHLHSDALLLHKLSDAIHFEIYNTPGIASKKILYSVQKGSNPHLSEIWLKHFDCLEGEQITYENSTSINPILIPNSNQFIYTCYKFGQPKLFISDLDKTTGSPLIQFRGNQLLPSISPVGNFIAFISDASGRPDLFVQQLSHTHKLLGKPQQVYSHKTATQASSSFSPDCCKIAFVSDQSGTPRVYLIDLSETIKTRKIPKIKCISNLNRENTSPSWSPDGKKIAFSAKTNGVRQIWIYDLESHQELQVTKGLGHKENPRWAANSLHIIYNTTTPTFDLFVVNLNQINPVQLTHGSGVKHYPYWEQKSH